MNSIMNLVWSIHDLDLFLIRIGHIIFVNNGRGQQLGEATPTPMASNQMLNGLLEFVARLILRHTFSNAEYKLFVF